MHSALFVGINKSIRFFSYIVQSGIDYRVKAAEVAVKNRFAGATCSCNNQNFDPCSGYVFCCSKMEHTQTCMN